MPIFTYKATTFAIRRSACSSAERYRNLKSSGSRILVVFGDVYCPGWYKRVIKVVAQVLAKVLLSG
ncbi:hypothetical protein [Rivularia sp. UHCC 0363]|uniref:hypothetical protein n=1 Tax=Rivularia sp. UHCC 0363 TaxID=3110244 RepID=UPI002B200EEA|nr:hypothetical protein [Rivularia sp. UHCC 0363]MEA5593383.1 hypothetical protein [Rivularia sp. UHCC 0363]